MPSSTILNSLKINKLTEAQFDAAVQQGIIGANDLSILIDADNPNIQVNTLPTASIDELDKIYQYVGATDQNYTNGYFYKCVSDGQSTPTYSWTQVNVQPGGGGGSYTAGSGINITSGVISVTSPTVVESGVSSGVTDSHSIFGGTVTDNYSIAIGSGASASDEYNTVIGKNASSSGEYSVAIGTAASTSSHYTTAVGAGSSATYKSTAIGRSCNASGTYSTALGWNCTASGNYSVQLGGAQYGVTNSTANTIKYANTNGNFEIVSADGTIPADRLKNAINKYSTMPTAASTNEGWVVQYTGTTNANYTHGYIYECVSDGGNPATYSWSAVQVQAGGGGSLPSQSGNAGKFLTTDGTNASWGDALVNTATGTNSLVIQGSSTGYSSSIGIGVGATLGGNNSTAIGKNAVANSAGVAIGFGAANSSSTTNGVAIGCNAATAGSSVAVGHEASTTASNATALGYKAHAYAQNAIQLGSCVVNGNIMNNSDANTFKVCNGLGNYEIMSANGTIPTDRYTTTPSSDGNYVPTLSISSGTATRSWTSIASSVSSSSTNSETVGAKLFYDTVGNIEAALQAINSGS